MKLYGAKLLTVICEILAREGVVEILKRHGVTGYTTYEVDGKGARGLRGRGLKDEKNVKIEAITGEERLSGVVEEISRTMFADFAVVLHVGDVGVLRPEKF